MDKIRSQEDIERIKNRITDPYEVNDFISQEDVDHLISLFEHHADNSKIYKNTGPITLDLNQYFNDLVIKKILINLKEQIGPFDVTAAFFFSTTYPHIIHNDDTYELPDVYKGITIPLKIYGSDQLPKLCFFDQFYFQGPAKFFAEDADIPTYYNKQVYDYKDLDGVVDGMLIDEATRVTYLTHLKPKWLTGLSFWGALNWKPKSALIFDSTRLHCANDFRKQGISRKLGISIFTKKRT
jgi:hypothetical protein